jgi:glycyl-tRNA synthetase beta chain
MENTPKIRRMLMTNYLLEIGLEEIPAHLVTPNIKQLSNLIENFLKSKQLSFKEIKTFSTPRRLSVEVIEIAENSQAIDEELRGPSLKVAKNEDGTWSKAAQGFARSKNASTDDFIEKNDYVYLHYHIEGIPAREILKSIGKEAVEQMKFTTYMKWSNYSFEYIRPIRWIVSILDNEIIPFKVLDIEASNVTFGHRFLSSDFKNIDSLLGAKIVIENASSYEKQLNDSFVIADSKKRKQDIKQQIINIAQTNNWSLKIDEDLLEEVNNIVEWPTAFAGKFDSKYLEIPDEVLITSMRENQRFFYVADSNNDILPYFISVRNGNEKYIENVIAGNEKVLVARLEDANFFYKEDLKQNIDFYMNKVNNIVFHAKIGNIKEHMQRVGVLSSLIGTMLQISDENKNDLTRASEIYKFDLATGMVNEFDNLQGIIGEYYAVKFGENQNTAHAIKEQYMPISADGELPQSDTGSILSIADKLDGIITFYAAGLTPSGSNDPYGLRRAALGITKILINKNWNINLKKLINDYIFVMKEDKYGLDDNLIANFDKVSNDVIEFIIDRVRQINKDLIRNDILIAATSNALNGDVAYINNRIKVLNEHKEDKNFKEVIESLTRIQNLVEKNLVEGIINEKLLNESEIELYTKTKDLNLENLKNDGAEKIYEILSSLQPTINNYFENVMVMDQNEEIKRNRLIQLNKINQLNNSLGDLTKIVIK